MYFIVNVLCCFLFARIWGRYSGVGVGVGVQWC
jgi:hypothetical protein